MTLHLHCTDYHEIFDRPKINGHVITDIEYGAEFDIFELLEKFTGTIITFEKPNRYFDVMPTHEYFWIKPSLPKNTVNGLSNPVESIYVWQRAPFNGPKITGMSNGNYSAVRYDQIEGFQLSPFQKPESLMRWLIALHTQPGDTIFDLCAGTGTTLRAANALGRHAVGWEIDSRMIDICRWANGLTA